jgi:hypothetical protein
MSMGMVDLFWIWRQLEALWTDRGPRTEDRGPRTEGDKRRSGGREQIESRGANDHEIYVQLKGYHISLRFSTMGILLQNR